mmetsp:Transcript_3900/g.6500  ORF Transcript_3900/g.6500 Transcript_3900/m.6500 type:complete len:216 (-) Transcript_3900:763-1410(-)
MAVSSEGLRRSARRKAPSDRFGKTSRSWRKPSPLIGCSRAGRRTTSRWRRGSHEGHCQFSELKTRYVCSSSSPSPSSPSLSLSSSPSISSSSSVSSSCVVPTETPSLLKRRMPRLSGPGLPPVNPFGATPDGPTAAAAAAAAAATATAAVDALALELAAGSALEPVAERAEGSLAALVAEALAPVALRARDSGAMREARQIGHECDCSSQERRQL